MTLERIVQFHGAYDLRRPEPRKNYGIHGMEIIFAVKGSKGAVTLNIFTDWHLPHVAGEIQARKSKGYPYNLDELCLPNIVDIGFHSKLPIYGEQTPMENCELTDGNCYYGDSSLQGNEQWREGFLHGGTGWLWPRLEQYYQHIFDGGDRPDLTPIPKKHPDEKIEDAPTSK